MVEAGGEDSEKSTERGHRPEVSLLSFWLFSGYVSGSL